MSAQVSYCVDMDKSVILGKNQGFEPNLQFPFLQFSPQNLELFRDLEFSTNSKTFYIFFLLTTTVQCTVLTVGQKIIFYYELLLLYCTVFKNLFYTRQETWIKEDGLQ